MRKKPVSGHWVMARTVRHMCCWLLALAGVLLSGSPARADSSGAQLAAYYDRQMVIRDGIAYGWSGSERPQPMISDVIQVGVGKDSYYALRKDGTLLTWSSSPANAALLMREVVGFAAGSSGWLAINRTRSLWQGSGREPPRKIAERVIAAAVGDGSDYYIDQAGDLYVRSQANRGPSPVTDVPSPAANLSGPQPGLPPSGRTAAARCTSRRAVKCSPSAATSLARSKQGPGDQGDRCGQHLHRRQRRCHRRRAFGRDSPGWIALGLGQWFRERSEKDRRAGGHRRRRQHLDHRPDRRRQSPRLGRRPRPAPDHPRPLNGGEGRGGGR
ncbi:MAG: hypothetical protein V5B44_13080 [Candidatus Accumulibacter necessarius]|uniref:hypothetical protein n=1 Tax=Candidatus Accumulibacter necessarius TaxID=2954386 RepID=UPI002FC3BBB3